MNEYIIMVTIKAKVKSDLSREDAIAELYTNTMYELPSVEGVEVIDTELLEAI